MKTNEVNDEDSLDVCFNFFTSNWGQIYCISTLIKKDFTSRWKNKKKRKEKKNIYLIQYDC